MSVGSRILDRFGYISKAELKKKNDSEKEKGKYKTVTIGGTSFGGISAVGRDEQTLKQFRTYYESEGTVFAAINNIADNVTMVGYHLTSEKENAKKLVQNYIDDLNLIEVLLDNITYALIYGDAYIEVVYGKSGDIVDLNTVDPVTMVINTDKYGKIKNYQQKIKGQLQSPIKPEFIIHIRLFSANPSSPYGLSIISPSLAAINRMAGVDEALYQAVKRHIAKYLIKVGTPEDLPPKAVFNDIKSELEDLEAKNEIITTGLVDITTIDERGVEGVSEYVGTFEEKALVGMMIAPEAVGRGQKSTEASARVREILYERYIRGMQTKVSNKVNMELINKILSFNNFEENSVKLKFKGTTTADEEGAAKWIGNILRGYPVGAKPITINEVRAIFGYEPLDGGDELIMGKLTGEDQEETPDDENPDEEEENKPPKDEIKPPVNQPAD